MVCVLQRRETDDFLTWRWLTRWLEPDVVQHWLLVGSTEPVTTHVEIREGADGRREVSTAEDQQGCLAGTIYMLPHQPTSRGATFKRWALAEMRDLLQPRGKLADRQMDQLVVKLDRLVRWRIGGAVRVEFALMRTGELRLWHRDDVAAQLSWEALKVHSRQAYFFVKDMVHHHVHHEPSSDQITPLVPVSTASPAKLASGDQHWRRETVWSLSRAAEILIRAGNLTALRQAMGIIAHADAFQKTLLPYHRSGDDPSRFIPNETVHSYNYDHITDSTRVLIEQEQAKRTHNTSMLVAALASSIAAVSLLISMISAYNARIDPGPGQGVREGLIELNFPEVALRLLAYAPFSVVICSCVAVSLISLLVTDNGSRLIRRGPRKIAQAARGISLSLGRRLGFGATGTHRLLVGIYVTAITALVVAGVWAPWLAHLLIRR